MRRKPIDIDAVIKMRSAGQPWAVIATALGVTRNTVQARLKDHLSDNTEINPADKTRLLRPLPTSNGNRGRSSWNSINGLTPKKKPKNPNPHTVGKLKKKLVIVADADGKMGRLALPAGHEISCTAIGLKPYAS
jgi:hypothetical protein